MASEIEELKTKIERIRAQYAYDVCDKNKYYHPKPVCKNQPPEITNLMNACLTCPMRGTCRILFYEK